MQQALEEKINDESQPEFVRRRAAQMFTAMMEAQDPRLQQQAEVRNPVAELDVDIKLEQSLDTVNIQQEQFEMLMNYSQAGGNVPITEILKLSSFRNKDELVESIEEAQKGAAEAAQAAMQAEIQQKQAEIKLEAEKEMVIQSQRLESNERIKAAELELEEKKLALEAKKVGLQVQGERDKAAVRVDADRQVATIRQEAAKVAPREAVLRIDADDSLKQLLSGLSGQKDTEEAQIERLIDTLNTPRTVEIRRTEGGAVAQG